MKFIKFVILATFSWYIQCHSCIKSLDAILIRNFFRNVRIKFCVFMFFVFWPHLYTCCEFFNVHCLLAHILIGTICAYFEILLHTSSVCVSMKFFPQNRNNKIDGLRQCFLCFNCLCTQFYFLLSVVKSSIM